jgi:hypothetical protein
MEFKPHAMASKNLRTVNTTEDLKLIISLASKVGQKTTSGSFYVFVLKNIEIVNNI